MSIEMKKTKPTSENETKAIAKVQTQNKIARSETSLALLRPRLKRTQKKLERFEKKGAPVAIATQMFNNQSLT